MSQFILETSRTGVNGSSRLMVTIPNKAVGDASERIEVTPDNLRDISARIASMLPEKQARDIEKELRGKLDASSAEDLRPQALGELWKSDGMNNITIHSHIKNANGTARGTIEARRDGELVHSDTFDLGSATSRGRFATAVAKALGTPAAAKTILPMLVAELDSVRAAGRRDARDATRGEIDAGHVTRPEIVISSALMAITVAETFLRDGKPAGRWRLYQSWDEGKREVIDLPDVIKLPDGSSLYVHPQPSDPTPSAPAWSAESRRRWLSGADAPNAAAVFRAVRDAIGRFIDFPEPETPSLLALWVVLSYIFPAWDAVPYLYVGGPLGSGKTRVADVLGRIAFRPLFTSNVSAPALFRTLNERGGTLFLDEAERLQESTPDAAELRSILLAGYRKGGKATRLEATGDTFRTIEFDVYGLKLISCIRGVPPALASRCITVRMFRSPPGSLAAKRRIDESPELWSGLRDSLHELSLCQLGPIALAMSNMSNLCPLSGRDYELWQPLLAIAAEIDEAGEPGLLAMMTAYAKQSAEAAEEERTPDTDETILRILAEKIVAGDDPTAGDILASAKTHASETFKKWTERSVSNLLRRYGLRSSKSGGRRPYSEVTIEQLRRIGRSYFLDLSLPPTPDIVASLASQTPFPSQKSGTIGTIGTQEYLGVGVDSGNGKAS